MRLGLVSDTHDNAQAVARVVTLFRRERVRFVLHAGDVTEPATLARFGEWPGALAFGNNDVDARGLAEAAGAIGWSAGESWTGALDGLRVALAHGHQRGVVAALATGAPDLLVVGHSHRVRDDVAGGVRVLNPGACFRAASYTAATFDTATRAFRVHAVAKDARGF